MASLLSGRRAQARRPDRSFPARTLRRGPSRILLLLAALTVAAVSAPIVFLAAEIGAAPDGAAWEVLTRPRTLSLVVSTLGLVLAVTAGTLLLGIPTAFLIARTDLPAVRFWHVAAALPLAVPSYVAGFTWVSLTPLRGFWGSLVVLVLATAPYVTLPVVAALRRADLTAEGVARTLGSGPFRAFLACTLPQIAPAAGAGALLVALYTVSEYGVVAIMRYPAFTWAIQTAFSGSFNRVLAVTLSLVLVAIALLIVTGERLLRRRTAPHGPVGFRAEADRIRLGRPARLASCAGLAVVLAGAVGVPVVSLIGRAARSVSEREIETQRLIEAAGTTVALGIGGALLATALALPVAVLASRHRTRSVAALETASYLGHGLPGIVLGLAMVSLSLALVPALYQTLALLVIAYGILFVPKATGSARAAIEQVPTGLEDAARSLGRSPLGTWLSTTGRLALPGIMTGALLVALTVMKELPATLMMRPTGVDTLATRLWQLTDISAYGAAAPYAIALILVASVPALLLTRQTERTPA